MKFQNSSYPYFFGYHCDHYIIFIVSVIDVFNVMD